jgi:hypothetical protein
MASFFMDATTLVLHLSRVKGMTPSLHIAGTHRVGCWRPRQCYWLGRPVDNNDASLRQFELELSGSATNAGGASSVNHALVALFAQWSEARANLF